MESATFKGDVFVLVVDLEKGTQLVISCECDHSYTDKAGTCWWGVRGTFRYEDRTYSIDFSDRDDACLVENALASFNRWRRKQGSQVGAVLSIRRTHPNTLLPGAA